MRGGKRQNIKLMTLQEGDAFRNPGKEKDAV